MNNKLSVSLMCADQLRLYDEIKRLDQAGVDYFHIDIMDSIFVPNITLGIDTVNAMRSITNTPFDIHLLLSQPKNIIHDLELRPNDIVTFHAEAVENPLELIAHIKKHEALVGVALNPETQIQKIEHYLVYIDVITLMLITPGFAGSQMIHGIMHKVKDFRQYLDDKSLNDVRISVDGGVSAELAKAMSKDGASIFVGGTSGVFRKDMPFEKAIKIFYDHIS
jgi:ribulose-phosphate 3-epimerase